METTAVVKAPTELALRLGSQELRVPGEAKKILLTKTSQGYTAEEVATLGESDVFVRRDSGGNLNLIYKAVKLYADKKEIAKLGKADDSPWIITVLGYNKLNQIAGIYIITPPTIFVAGIEHSNPYVEYANGEIKRVIARKIAIGYSPIGNLVAIDTVRHYNFDAYYLQDLQAKAKWKPAAARFGTVFQCPFALNAQVQEKSGHSYAKEGDKVYVFKPIKDVEGIWIDPSNDEILEVYSQHIQHQKFGEVIGQSLCSRNALKAHPAIASSQVMPKNGVAEVMVFGWRHGLEKEQLSEMARTIAKGEQAANVLVRQDTGEDELAEVQIALETEVDETAAEPAAGNGKQKPPENLLPKIQKLAQEKTIDIEAMSRNLFQTRSTSLTFDQQKKLLDVVEKAAPGKPQGEKGGKAA